METVGLDVRFLPPWECGFSDLEVSARWRERERERGGGREGEK